MDYILRDRRVVEIRPLTAGEAGQFNPFMRQIAEESTHTLRYRGQPETPVAEIATRWEDAARLGNKLYLGALHDGRLVGYLFCQMPYWEHPWMRHLGYFALMSRQAFSGVGLGREMLHQLDVYAQTKGLRRMEATVRTDNPRALGLYLSCGYQIEGLRRGAACIDGQVRDEHYIAKLY